MTDMQFETNPNEFGRPPVQGKGFDLTGKLIGWGLVSSRKEAEYVLIAVAVVALLAAFYFFTSSSGGVQVKDPIYATPQAQ